MAIVGVPSDPWPCRRCTFLNEEYLFFCEMCERPRFVREGTSSSIMLAPREQNSHGRQGLLANIITFIPNVAIPSIFNGVVSGAVTGIFAILGACTGAVAGALAGRATESGILRGVGLGAVAGTVVSIEVLEASRAFWRNSRNMESSARLSSTVQYLEDALSERLVQEPVFQNPGNLRWQLDIDNMSYDELYSMFGPGRPRQTGLSPRTLAAMPAHIISPENLKLKPSCPVCLEELCIGDAARTLESCRHSFHKDCIDKWLAQHAACPVCRAEIS